jgi:hypothetical protein
MSEDSYPVGKSRCPACAKQGRDTHGDNLIEYSDGHSFCYACGCRIKARIFNVPFTAKSERSGKERKNLPSTFLGIEQNHLVGTIPTLYLQWLLSYKITDSEIKEYGIKYNEATSSLHFKIPGGAYVERFNEEASPKESNVQNKGRVRRLLRRPKWMLRVRWSSPVTTRGWVLGTGGNVVLVEDVVSAIRCHVALKDYHQGAGVAQILPLLGTNINANDLYRLCRERSGVRVWLDRDKRDKALKIASRASQWNNNVCVICSEKDPKEYSSEEIKSFIRGVELSEE